MRQQPIKRVIDARGGQGRVLIHLACGHNLGIPAETLEQTPLLVKELGLYHFEPGERTMQTWPCTLCPDAPVEKSATQMWKEAGEP